MSDTQDDCRRAFERWYNDFPVGGRAAKEGLAWTVWQAAWSSRLLSDLDSVQMVYYKRGFKKAQAMYSTQPNVEELVKEAIALIRKWANKGEL